MAGKTSIEWTTRSSNPIFFRLLVPHGDRAVGKRGHFCVKAGDDCANCYSEGMNRWIGTGLDYDGPNLSKVEVCLDEAELARLRKLKDGKVFMGDMTDLFGHWVTDAMLDAIFDAMEANPRVIFQLLTKRPHRMASYLKRRWGSTPPRHIWCGASVGYEPALRRLEQLRAVPAAVRYLSLEPLIGRLGPALDLTGIHWAIVGGESGRRNDIRPMAPSWAREIREACRRAGTAFFFKQWGAWMPALPSSSAVKRRQIGTFMPDGTWLPNVWHGAGECMQLIGNKKITGRILDGRTWDEFPQVEVVA